MKKGNRVILAGLLLIAAALCLTGYNLWDAHRAGVRSQQILGSLLPEINTDPAPAEGRMQYRRIGTQKVAEDEIEYPDYVLNPDMDMPVKVIDGNAYIGVLSIPAAELELPVFSEWNYTNLKTAPCRYSGTAYLDNMVICAHNYDIHFGTLKNLSYGDSVVFTDMSGNVFEYRVIEIGTVQPTAVEEMKSGEWDLTLFTCTIDGTTRVTVRCERE